jgi:hypothetical protein
MTSEILAQQMHIQSVSMDNAKQPKEYLTDLDTRIIIVES